MAEDDSVAMHVRDTLLAGASVVFFGTARPDDGVVVMSETPANV